MDEAADDDEAVGSSHHSLDYPRGVTFGGLLAVLP